MNKQVEKLVEDLAQSLENTSDVEWEGMPETSEHKRSKEDCREYSVWTLKNLAKKYDLALIEKHFLWKIKAMLRGIQIKQQSDPTITWETSLDVALKEFDDNIIPLAEALGKEVKR